MSMRAVQAASATQDAVTTTAVRSARHACWRSLVRGKGCVGLDAEDGAEDGTTDMRARYTLVLDLH